MIESLAIGEDQAIREAPSLNFGPEDLMGVVFLNSDALVIRVTIANYEVTRVLVDSRSLVNVLF